MFFKVAGVWDSGANSFGKMPKAERVDRDQADQA
jgi:hypothetical protein